MKFLKVLNGIWTAFKIWKAVKPDVEPIVEEKRKKAEEKFKEEQKRKQQSEN